MASPPVVLLAFVLAVAVFSAIGLAVARWLDPDWAPPISIAPVLGWGVFSALSFPLQTLIGFNKTSTAIGVALALALSVWALTRKRPTRSASGPGLPRWAFILALLVALIPLAALLPKPADGGIIIGTTAFDHSKIAMVDEMTRLGLPVGNPFFGAQGARSSLAYYFLWHFSAAQLSILLHVSGWEADAAMTGFTAYASLMLMMGLATRMSAQAAAPDRARGRIGVAVVLVALLSLTGSLRQLMVLMIGWDGVHALLSTYTGLAGWMDQASWVPQHMQSACCVVLTALMLIDLAKRPRPGAVLVIAALAAAGFGSSAWVGGITFALCALGAGVVGLSAAKGRGKLWFASAALAAAFLALILSLPMLHAEFATLGSRQGGSPIALHPYEVLGGWVPTGLRRLLDLPAYWLVLLPVELLAIYPVGMVALVLYLRKTSSPTALGLAMLTVVSLATAWLLISTIGNNDLGWRAILPAVLVLTALTAACMARWFGQKAWIPLGIAVLLALLCGLDRQIFQNLHGRDSQSAPDFAQSPAMWAAVRQYAGPQTAWPTTPNTWTI